MASGPSEAQWLPPGAWSACRDDFEVEEGEPLIVGIDIGGSRAASALVACTEDLRIAHVEVFHGEQSVLQVTEALLRLAAVHALAEVAYDPWRYQSEALRLERDHGLVMVQFPQSHARMVPASERLHSAVVEKRLRHRASRNWPSMSRERSPSRRARLAARQGRERRADRRRGLPRDGRRARRGEARAGEAARVALNRP